MALLPLDRLLQSQGFGTRRHCRQLVEDGEVDVSGTVVTDWRTPVETSGLHFTVFGEPWEYRAQVYLALHKPAGYECSRKPSRHKPVLDLLPENFRWREVQPVGRLDQDTTGLLLLSDDGRFIHAQSSPRHHVPKRYEATTAEPVTPALIDTLLAGVQLIDEEAPLAALGAGRLDTHRLWIELDQGKYHQVKRMLAAAGNHCTALHRAAIGALELSALNLATGAWCYIEPTATDPR